MALKVRRDEVKTAEYPLVGGGTWRVEYDETAPCKVCGEPVGSASMGGVDICPSCDCGRWRDGRKWTPNDCPPVVKESLEKLKRMMNGAQG